MKQKIKDFVFGVPSGYGWIWNALMVAIILNMLTAIYINWADFHVVSWIMVALMWVLFYWMSELTSRSVIKRYQKLTSEILNDYSESMKVVAKIEEELRKGGVK